MGHLVRSAIQTPVRDVKMDSKQISLISIFAALYAIGVVFLAPFSFLPIQVRIADALLPLSIIFGMPVVIGLSLGTIVANIFGGLGFIDIIGGTVANFIATFVAWKICGSNKVPFIVGIGCQIVIVSMIVGVYISYCNSYKLYDGKFQVYAKGMTMKCQEIY